MEIVAVHLAVALGGFHLLVVSLGHQDRVHPHQMGHQGHPQEEGVGAQGQAALVVVNVLVALEVEV